MNLLRRIRSLFWGIAPNALPSIAEKAPRVPYETASRGLTARIVCLANSVKLGGRCVAGIDIETRKWVRPVSGVQDGALFPHHYDLEDRQEPQLLDILEIGLSVSAPKAYQPENWLIADRPWRRLSHLQGEEALALLEPFVIRDGLIFGTLGDRVGLTQISQEPVAFSLALIQPVDVRWLVANNFNDRRQVRVMFRWQDQRYNLSVTDPLVRGRLLSLANDTYAAEAAGFPQDCRLLFTISLGEPFNGACYKLVAAVIQLP